MNGITIYEFDALTLSTPGFASIAGLHAVPAPVYAWLECQCLQAEEDGDGVAWLKLSQKNGRPAVRVNSFVGVIRAPNGFQIEVLPKIGKAIGSGTVQARQLLIDMLCCLRDFRHIQTDTARISAAHMPLLEVFIAEFLHEIDHVVKRGLRSDYTSRQGHLFALKGKLLMGPHLRQSLHRVDRFFTEHDDFSPDRPENRLLHAALKNVLALSTFRQNQQHAQQLLFVFSEVPASSVPKIDFQRVRPERSMAHYADALTWARLILNEKSPLTGTGRHNASSLLFPMEVVFEAFVAKHLARQLLPPFALKRQASTQHLVKHLEQRWFRLKPDLLIRDEARNSTLVLDTKWKLLDSLKANGTQKYGLSQSDFYQLQAYGQAYLGGSGHVVLIYPRTDAFDEPLPVFEFSHAEQLRLWVLPFCLKSRQLVLPKNAPFAAVLSQRPEKQGLVSK